MNLRRREYLHPHKFGDGLKLLEFGCGGDILTGLTVLLASSLGECGRGGGDLRLPVGFNAAQEYVVTATEAQRRIWKEGVGRWAGDPIAIIGDYAAAGDPGNPYGINHQTIDQDPSWNDVSELTIRAMCLDCYVREELEKKAKAGCFAPDYLRGILQEAKL